MRRTIRRRVRQRLAAGGNRSWTNAHMRSTLLGDMQRNQEVDMSTTEAAGHELRPDSWKRRHEARSAHQPRVRRRPIQESMNGWVGGWTPTTPRWTAFALSSSRPRTPRPRSTSVRDSPRRAGLGPVGLVVDDIEAAPTNSSTGASTRVTLAGPTVQARGRQPGVDPERASYGSSAPSTIPTAISRWSRKSAARLPGREWE